MFKITVMRSRFRCSLLSFSRRSRSVGVASFQRSNCRRNSWGFHFHRKIGSEGWERLSKMFERAGDIRDLYQFDALISSSSPSHPRQHSASAVVSSRSADHWHLEDFIRSVRRREMPPDDRYSPIQGTRPHIWNSPSPWWTSSIAHRFAQKVKDLGPSPAWPAGRKRSPVHQEMTSFDLIRAGWMNPCLICFSRRSFSALFRR